VLIEILRKIIIVRSEVLGCVITSISLTVARLKAKLRTASGSLVAWPPAGACRVNWLHMVIWYLTGLDLDENNVNGMGMLLSPCYPNCVGVVRMERA
jgi:hypothetical protein